MGDAILCFTCCLTEQPQPKRRRRIDATMIGIPTNFRHTGHIGTGDMGNRTHLNSIQNQMSSKGGYDHTSPVSTQLTTIDIQKENQENHT